MMLRGYVLVAALGIAGSAPLHAQVEYAFTGKPVASFNEPFTVISGIRELTGNRVIVLDQVEKHLSLVELGTGKQTAIGRTGGGPGEYQNPTMLFAGSDLTTLAADPLGFRLHVISPDGKITSSIPTAASNNEGFTNLILPRSADDHGGVYYEGRSISLTNPTATEDSVPVIRWDTRTGKRDTVTWLAAIKATVSTSGSNVTITRRVTPFAKRDTWVALPQGGVAVVRAEPYRVDIIGMDRKTNRGAVVAYTPIRVTAAERDAYRKAQAAARPQVMNLGGGTASASASAAAARAAAPPNVADADFPATMPAFPASLNAARTSPDGRVWVQRSRASSDPNPRYDVFSPQGQLIGHATLKPNSSIVGFGANAIYIARQDTDDDLRYLEKYEMR